MVFQDVVLFDDTVMENIRLGKRGATDEEVRAAAKAQHLQRVGQHFQPSCRDFGVDRFFIPSNDFSGNGNRRFPVKILQQSVIMHDYLRHAILIPQVEKSHAAVIRLANDIRDKMIEREKEGETK